ncbi:MAG: SxtJ family membrane protein [Bacteroidota bacterium]
MQTPKQNTHTTILVMVTGFLVLYFIFKAQWLITVAASVAVVSLVIPPVGRLIEKAWYKLAQVLGWINTRILLSIVFFLILFPIAWLTRLFGKVSLQLKRPKDTVFTTRNHQYSKADFENMW